MSSIPAPIRTTPAAPRCPCCGTSSARRSSTTNRRTSSGCSTRASARSPPQAPDLYPEDLREDIDAVNAEVYPKLNNGVYRAGFATTQAAYEEAFAGVFEMLDALERRLSAGGPLSVRRAADRGRPSALRHARPLRPRLSRSVQVQLAPDQGLSALERLSGALDCAAGLSRNLQPRPHQARILRDQSPQPDPRRPPRAGAGRGAGLNPFSHKGRRKTPVCRRAMREKLVGRMRASPSSQPICRKRARAFPLTDGF